METDIQRACRIAENAARADAYRRCIRLIDNLAPTKGEAIDLLMWRTLRNNIASLRADAKAKMESEVASEAT